MTCCAHHLEEEKPKEKNEGKVYAFILISKISYRNSKTIDNVSFIGLKISHRE